ncbi:MAG: tetratricopeptide repeat protein [Myxococcota bacterium]|nr:tetratricopeptide repeat protein [Myxococcota bacterium]
MVKRIRKRVSRTPDEQVEGEATSGGATGEPTLSDELAAMGEDRFTESIAQGFKVVVDNQKLLVTVAILIVAGAIGLYFAQESKSSAVAGASEGFQTGADAYAEATAAPAPQEDPNEEKNTPLTPSEKKTRLENAQRDFAKTVKVNADTPIATLASLGEASTLAALGKQDQALPILGKVAAQPSVTPMVQAIAIQGQAALLETKGDQEGALGAWRRLGQLNPAFALVAGTQEARLLEALGKKSEALKRYQDIQKKHGALLDKLTNRDLKSQVERSILRLGA